MVWLTSNSSSNGVIHAVMSYFHSTSATLQDQEAILSIVTQATRFIEPVKVLVSYRGLLPWLLACLTAHSTAMTFVISVC